MKRVISMSVLPGEPTDGTGRLCIHLWVNDPDGLFTEPHVMNPIMKDSTPEKGQFEFKPTHGRLACNSKRDPAPTTRGGVIFITMRSIEARAVTCPKCKASEEYKLSIAQTGE